MTLTKFLLSRKFSSVSSLTDSMPQLTTAHRFKNFDRELNELQTEPSLPVTLVTDN